MRLFKCTPCVSGTRLHSSLSAPRRLQQRAGWPSALPVDEDLLPFPDEHLGNEYALNWSIASYNMSVAGSAYHNLHLRGLTMLAEGRLDAHKAVARRVDARDNAQVLLVGSQVTDAAFGAIIRSAREALSASERLFVHDGSVGLTRGSGPTVRTFCGAGIDALMLHQTLRSFRLPLQPDDEAEIAQWTETLPEDLRRDPERVAELVRLDQLTSPTVRDPHALTQFLIPALDVDVPGAHSRNVTLIDAKRQIILHAGTNINVDSVRRGLVKLATLSSTWAPDSVVLPADAYLDASGRGAVVVFGGAGARWGGVAPWSAHDTLWLADDSLVPIWMAGSVVDMPSVYGDYVEETAAKHPSVVGRRRGPLEPFSVGAKAVLFVDPTRKESVKANPEQARKHGLPDPLVERIAKSKVPLYLVPPRGDEPVAAWITQHAK